MVRDNGLFRVGPLDGDTGEEQVPRHTAHGRLN